MIPYAVLIAAGALLQLPGQYPRTSPFPIPGRVPGPTTTPVPGRQPPPSSPGVRIPPQLKNIAIKGVLRRYSRTQIIVESEDHRIAWFRPSDDFTLSGSPSPAPGDWVTVVGLEDVEGRYSASELRWLSTGSESEKEAALRSWDLPSSAAAPPQPANDRPVIRRGGPPAKSDPPDEPAALERPTDRPDFAPLDQRPDDPVIARARDAAASYIETLPSFSTRQSTMRYVRETARGEWKAQDVVSANLVYRNGEEVYSDIRVGRDRAEGRMEDIEGLRSTGEFGSMLAEIFDPNSGASFTRGSSDEIRGRRAVKYAYTLPRERSWFRIAAPSELFFTGYKGTLWLDSETNRVLRLEIQATGLPQEFPFDTVEVAVDYDFVRLEASRTFLLPIEAQALDCIRSTSVCMRNQTTFRNYVKFDAESGIIFDKPVDDRQ